MQEKLEVTQTYLNPQQIRLAELAGEETLKSFLRASYEEASIQQAVALENSVNCGYETKVYE